MRAVKLTLTAAALAVAASAVSLAAHASPVTYTLSDVTYNEVAHEAGFSDSVQSWFNLTLDGGAFVSGVTPMGEQVGSGQWDTWHVDMTMGIIEMAGLDTGVELLSQGGNVWSGAFGGDGTKCGNSPNSCIITGTLGWMGTTDQQPTDVPEPGSLALLVAGLTLTTMHRRNQRAQPRDTRRVIAAA